MRSSRLLAACAAGFIAIVCTRGAVSAETVVPEQSRVAERDARLELARLLAGRKSKEAAAEALRQYDTLRRENPGDVATRRERAGLLMRLRRSGDAANELRDLSAQNPANADLRADYADAENALGHAARAREQYRRAISAAPGSDGLRLRYARQMRAWGDFHESERLLRRELARTGKLDVHLDLADVLVGSQQYEAAEDEYRAILRRDRGNVPALLGLAEIRMREKDYAAVLPRADAVLARDSGNATAHRLKEQATRALTAPTIPRASDSPVAEPNTAGTAAQLAERAASHSSQGAFKPAIALYRGAIARDPAYFPAQLGLAEVLAADQQYEEAITRFRELLAQFPGNSKVTLSLARVLSWSRRYDESLQVYATMVEANPRDAVPRRERARVAAWSKQMDLAQRYYAELTSPPLDEQLRQRGYARQSASEDERPYAGYESLTQTEGQTGALDELYGTYRLQKSVWLEARGKLLAWDRRFLRSEDIFQELVAFQPGQQEALFDLAQVQASQNLRARATETYEALLRIDPLHNLAARALRREEVLASPAVEASYNYWNEEGSGRNSDIQRQTFTAGGELVIRRQHWLDAGGVVVEESPAQGFGSATSHGARVALDSTWNEYVSTSGALTVRQYDDSRLGTTATGHASVTGNVYDYVRLTGRYRRYQEIPNGFALRQQIHVDAAELAAETNITRKLELRGAASAFSYSDDNKGVWAWIAPGFTLLDHPRTLKLVARGEYRDTSNQSIYDFHAPSAGGGEAELRNIVHPYWTPDNYLRGQLIAEWRHDLSRDFYAGAELHYYALRAGVGTDNTENNSWRLEAEWRLDFSERWSAHAIASLERSREWDGESVAISLSCRFP